jgi:hypothetical protein
MKKNIWLVLTAIIALNTTSALFANDNDSSNASTESQVASNDEGQSSSESKDADSAGDAN